MKLIESIAQLKVLATTKEGDFVDFFVILSGFARSSKRIMYCLDFDQFCIINEIDESYQEPTTDELALKTILVEAIEKNSLYMDPTSLSYLS